ncbi:flagellar basal body-associated FliL family protein [Rhodovulum sp. YNF3179]|uniref:flagellar basal body-associated FliL family protein n=1 Tax=Rhodovulum sp. YNF3179 TaxID=3425127 RepID=UPI003D339837
MAKVLPVLFALLGLGAGIGAGYFLRVPDPPPEETAAADCPAPGPEATPDKMPPPDSSPRNYAKLTNQFVVPLVSDGAVTALMVLSLSLEVAPAAAERVYEQEPRLRDAFLQVMFEHANAGGFTGNFTRIESLGPLRRALLEAAQNTLGPEVSDVLVTDILRQDS